MAPLAGASCRGYPEVMGPLSRAALALLLAAPAAAATAPQETVIPAIPIPGDLLPRFDVEAAELLDCFERIALPAGGKLEPGRPLSFPREGARAPVRCQVTARNNGVGQDLELRAAAEGGAAEYALGLDLGQPERFLFGGKAVIHETPVEWRFTSCGAVMCGEVRQLLGRGPGANAVLFKPNAEGELRPEGLSRAEIQASLDELFAARETLRTAAHRLRGRLAGGPPPRSGRPGGTAPPERERRGPYGPRG
jgi:hypothetical protein